MIILQIFNIHASIYEKYLRAQEKTHNAEEPSDES